MFATGISKLVGAVDSMLEANKYFNAFVRTTFSDYDKLYKNKHVPHEFLDSLSGSVQHLYQPTGASTLRHLMKYGAGIGVREIRKTADAMRQNFNLLYV